MYAKFQANWLRDNKVMVQTNRKCCKNDNQRDITQRQYTMSNGFCALHSVLLQKTHMPSFKSIGLEIPWLCSRQAEHTVKMMIKGK